MGSPKPRFEGYIVARIGKYEGRRQIIQWEQVTGSNEEAHQIAAECAGKSTRSDDEWGVWECRLVLGKRTVPRPAPRRRK